MSQLFNLKSLGAALAGAGMAILPELAKLPGPYGALAGAVLAVVLLHVKAPAAAPPKGDGQ